MKIKISSDSTCDLGRLVAENDINIVSLSVLLGENEYKDCQNIVPEDIFEYVKNTGVLPKTAAPSISEYEETFSKLVDEGYTVIHFNISQKASSSYNNACLAAEKFKNKVYVVDSKALSSGQGLMIMKAVDMVNAGVSAEKIVEECENLASKINTSFIPDKLEYLYKGGRCSKMSLYGANILKIHPLIIMEDGQLIPAKKYVGNMKRCIKSYIEDLKIKYPSYEKKRCFITHSNADKELVDFAIEKVKENFEFDEIIVTVANSVITGHCGKNTLGVLFISE